MSPEIGILNVGAGDTKISFDPANPKECERAAKIVTDMLRRGYSILVQVGEQIFDGKKEAIYRRAHAFDPKTNEYIIMDVGEGELDEPGREKAEKTQDRKPRGRPRRIRASGTHGISVGRSAGG